MNQPPLSRPVRLVVGFASAVGLVSALGGMGVAVFAITPPAWMMLGFEVVSVVAAVFGIGVALGRFADGPALALLCVAGAWGGGTLFGRLTAIEHPGLRALATDPWILGRGVLSAVVLAAGGYAVLMRDPRSWRVLIRGVVLGGLALAIVVGGWAMRGSALLRPATGPLEVLRIVMLFVAALVVGGLFSVGIHLVIRAFELGRAETDKGGSGTTA